LFGVGLEIFLRMLTKVRSVVRRERKRIEQFTTAVFDLVNMGGICSELPKTDPSYHYFQPLKTLLVRTVAGGGKGSTSEATTG